MHIMYKQFVIFVLILVVVPLVLAADAPPTELFVGQAEGNKFLAAEVTRQMGVAKTDIIQAVNDNNDQNFMFFDSRMGQLMADIKMKTVLAAIGAAMVANAIITIVLLRTIKNYSYEKYLEDTLEKYKTHQEVIDSPSKGMSGMQEQQWNVQQPADTLGNIYGQEFAGQATQMNQWLAQPNSGAWRAPVDTQQEFVQQPYGYQPSSIDDPMQSPGWDPRYNNG